MVDHGYITKTECDLAKQVKIENMLCRGTSTSDDSLFAYVDLVTKEVKEKTGLDPTETQMEIYTYCNQELQKKLQLWQMVKHINIAMKICKWVEVFNLHKMVVLSL